MATPAMSGDFNLQNYLTERYHFYHDSGYSKKDAHTLAFQDMLKAQGQGFIVEEQQPVQDPYLEVVYSDQGVL